MSRLSSGIFGFQCRTLQRRTKRSTCFARLGGKQSESSRVYSRLLGESQLGKSTIIKSWCEKIERQEKPASGRHPVVYVELSSHATVKSLGVDIMKALGADALPEPVIDDACNRRHRALRAWNRASDPFAKTNIDTVLYQALAALELAGTEMLVIDEIHHIVLTDTAKRVKNVTELLKWMTLRGVCPLVLAGIEDARVLFDATTNSQVTGRCWPMVELARCYLGDPEQKRTFAGFILALDMKLVEHGLLPERSNLVQSDWVACFHDATKGNIGNVAHIVEFAVAHAIKRKSSRVELEDLEFSTRKWAIPYKYADSNPWKDGPRDLRVIEAEKRMRRA